MITSWKSIRDSVTKQWEPTYVCPINSVAVGMEWCLTHAEAKRGWVASKK